MTRRSPLRTIYDDLRSGRITRREFLERATALGVVAPVALYLLQTHAAVAAQEASPVASPVASGGAPDSGTEGQQRGAGGELKILQWQAPSTLSVHISGSFKEMLAAALVTEPLLNFLPDGTAIPNLVKEIPSVENGLLAEDLTSVTYNLLEGVTWSDGEPFTASDVAFTWSWIVNPDNQSTNSTLYSNIANVEAIDDLTVRITFASPQIGWNTYFASCVNGAVYPAHILSEGTAAHDAFQFSPIGTGPYVVDSFAPNDQAVYSINENYREPNKPYFSTVNLKGGGDANTAATAVLQTGEWDFAWNLQVAPEILDELQIDGAGDLVVEPGTAVEWIALNFSDPNTEVDGQRSQWQTPHPFLSDHAVRQAMALAVPRQEISENLYSGPPGEPPASNVLVGIPAYESPNTSWSYDIEQGNQLLEEAGWVLNGAVREKDGVQLSLTYATSTNPIRQQTQQVVQQSWEQLGFEVRLLEIESSVFFSTDEANDQNVSHMYWDVHEYAFSPAGPWPLSYMLRWVSHDGENIPQRENGWSRVNEGRYNNPEYDALYDQVAATDDPEEAASIFIEMNDIIINDVVLIPIVQRASEKYGLSKRLNKENIAGGPFEALYWNIANWNEVS
jgi:peptide/nickel transport system substrate-binding protein